MTFFFSVLLRLLQPHSSTSPQNSLKRTTLLFLTLSKSTTPSLSSTSATITFHVADRSIRSCDLGVHFSRIFLLKSDNEYAHQNFESFGWSLFTKSISAEGEQIASTENEVTNDLAKFLNELAQWCMSWISASAESRTSRQPLDMKENVLEFDEEEDDVVAQFSLSMADSEKARGSLRSLKISRA